MTQAGSTPRILQDRNFEDAYLSYEQWRMCWHLCVALPNAHITLHTVSVTNSPVQKVPIRLHQQIDIGIWVEEDVAQVLPGALLLMIVDQTRRTNPPKDLIISVRLTAMPYINTSNASLVNEGSEYEVTLITGSAMVLQGDHGDGDPQNTLSSSTSHTSSSYRIGTAEGHALVTQGNMSENAFNNLLQIRAQSWGTQVPQTNQSQQQEDVVITTSTGTPRNRRLLDNRDSSPAPFRDVGVPKQIVLEVKEVRR